MKTIKTAGMDSEYELEPDDIPNLRIGKDHPHYARGFYIVLDYPEDHEYSHLTEGYLYRNCGLKPRALGRDCWWKTREEAEAFIENLKKYGILPDPLTLLRRLYIQCKERDKPGNNSFGWIHPETMEQTRKTLERNNIEI